MNKIIIILISIMCSNFTKAQITKIPTFQDSVRAVASDSLYNEKSILGAIIATNLNRIELRSIEGKEIMKRLYNEIVNKNTCEEIFDICNYDSVYETHAYNICNFGELSKLVVQKYPYKTQPRFRSAIEAEHTRIHPEVFQMYMDSHSKQ